MVSDQYALPAPAAASHNKRDEHQSGGIFYGFFPTLEVVVVVMMVVVNFNKTIKDENVLTFFPQKTVSERHCRWKSLNNEYHRQRMNVIDRCVDEEINASPSPKSLHSLTQIKLMTMEAPQLRRRRRRVVRWRRVPPGTWRNWSPSSTFCPSLSPN